MTKKVSVNWHYPIVGNIAYPILIISTLITVWFFNDEIIDITNMLHINHITSYLSNYYSVIWFIAVVWLALAIKLSRIYDNRKLLKDFIEKNNLYSSEKNEDGQKTITDSLIMEWVEDNKKIVIRVYKSGGPLDNLIDSSIGSKLQSFIKKELESENLGLDYIDYLFAMEEDERLIL